MSLYSDYLTQIENRKKDGLKPKPIEDGELLKEIILQIKDPNNKHRKNSIDFLIYNTVPGTTSAALEKSMFLKEIILDKRLSRFNLIYLYSLMRKLKKYKFSKVYDLQNSSRTSFYKKILLRRMICLSNQ